MRTRFIDDTIQSALSHGIEQVMILGTRFDTRPYRLAAIARVKVFEADLSSVQEDKKKKLQKHFGRLPEHVILLLLLSSCYSFVILLLFCHSVTLLSS